MHKVRCPNQHEHFNGDPIYPTMHYQFTVSGKPVALWCPVCHDVFIPSNIGLLFLVRKKGNPWAQCQEWVSRIGRVTYTNWKRCGILKQRIRKNGKGMNKYKLDLQNLFVKQVLSKK